jgi:F-box interacting protein
MEQKQNFVHQIFNKIKKLFNTLNFFCHVIVVLPNIYILYLICLFSFLQLSVAMKRKKLQLSVAMKRKKDSAAVVRASQRGNEAKGKVEEAKIDQLCPYFDNLPSHLTAHILLQLPLKSLLICKCVCKYWKTMISEPHFAKLHFEQASTSLIIRSGHRKRVARTMHLLECEPEMFEIGINIHVKLEPIFKLPLRDARSLREKRLNNHNIKRKQKLNIACNPENDKFKVVNSCNGFLCLCHPDNNIPLVICNPITEEFIRLPATLNTARVRMDGQAAFGFHSKTNEYKVINIWRKRNKFKPLMLEIHTLGTMLWRNVEVDHEISIWKLECLTCVNDTLHWIRHDNGKRSILCFSFESERFQSFPSPPYAFGNMRYESCMGELRGFLYIGDVSLHDVTLWVMNEYDIAESWTKVYNIDTSVVSFHPFSERYGLCWPIKHFKEDAALLLYHSHKFRHAAWAMLRDIGSVLV